jgi:alkylation response protein AidB-like acyl-CoA dehydrogenase
MYRAPISDIQHTLRHIADLPGMIDAGMLGDLSDDLVEAVLEEAGKFASEEIAPQRMPADRHGTPLKDGVVTLSPATRDVYHRWIACGWNGLASAEEWGGQGLPTMLATATTEMWNSASMAFGLGPMLTAGAIEALEAHGADDLKQKFLPKLVAGEWMGTMNLTEPQAGSDLNALRSRAERRYDGSYRIFGQKIYITYGEHDLTDNIIHLVLARLPDAPAGTRGISLFLVPKFVLDDDGNPAARNDVFCNGVEHKLGIHGSPTCTMIYGDGKFGDEPGAVGYLIGEENRGLACMFTMMNNARLAVGAQGVAVAEAATQLALNYAHERKQGRAPGDNPDGMSAIVHHPDIARTLLEMKALTAASRAICLCCAAALDRAEHSADAEKTHWSNRAGLLTPLAKAFSTDVGVHVANLGIQVHGGMGFVEETGAAQLLRDARIAPIYEGTNGIQGIDLVARKLPMEGGAHVDGYLAELSQIAATVRGSNQPEFGTTADRLDAAIAALTEATAWVQAQMKLGKQSAVLAGATAYQRLFALTAGSTLIAKGAVAGEASHRALARFAAENLLNECAGLKATVISGADSLDAAKSLLAVA